MASHSDHTDESAVKTNPTQQSEDEDKSTSTGGIESNQGPAATSSSEQTQHGDQQSDSNAEQKNEETSSDTQHTEETSGVSSGSVNQQGWRTETITTTTTTSSDGGAHGEESASTNASSASNRTEASSTGSDDTKKEESTLAAASPSSNAAQDGKNEHSSLQSGTAGAFHIEKGNGQHLTPFQRQKAKYFFNVNLDIENKEFLKWEDVEFYLLFHANAAGKEGSDGGDLEARLSRAARALWENIHDQVPLADGKRETLTLDQFLDTWASLADYVVRTNQLPPLVDELVKVGFELYATDDAEAKTKSIELPAFDQLFQKMELGRPYAIMAYKILTDNGSTPLDESKIESIVRSVITSSDDENSSHFLLPGFFKTIGNHQNRNKTPSPVQDNASSEKTPTSPSATTGTTSQTTTTTTQSNQSNARSSATTEGQKPPSPARQLSKPNESEQSASSVQNAKGPESSQQTSSTGQVQQQAPKAVIQQEDDGIRQLLRFYHIDDGDMVEVSGGSVQRVVLVHPERPLPQYIQQDKELLQKIQTGPNSVSSNTTQPPVSNRHTVPSQDPQSRVFLQERIARGEAQQGPSVPYRQEPQLNSSSSAGARQVYPPLSPAEQEQQRRQAQRQAAASSATIHEGKSNPSSVPAESKEKKEFTREDEKRIVASIIKQLTPLIERCVAEELRGVPAGDTDDEDDDGFIPFPFMFAGGRPGAHPSQVFAQQQFHQGPPQGIEIEGLPPGAAFIPPQLLMAMMNDLAAGEMSGFTPNRGPPPQGPAGMQGFAMFADGPPMMGGAPGYPPRSGPPRF